MKYALTVASYLKLSITTPLLLYDAACTVHKYATGVSISVTLASAR